MIALSVCVARRAPALPPVASGGSRASSLTNPPQYLVAQPPIAAKWFGRVFRSCVRLCGSSCVVRVTCVLLQYLNRLGFTAAPVPPPPPASAPAASAAAAAALAPNAAVPAVRRTYRGSFTENVPRSFLRWATAQFGLR